MVEKMERALGMALATLLLGGGASASPPGALEIKGPLAALSVESITVGAITCQVTAQTKFEKNDQHVTAAEFALGDFVELKYLEGLCLELEDERPQGTGGSVGNGSGSPKERLTAKLVPIVGGVTGGSGKVKAEKQNSKSKVEVEAKIPRAGESGGDVVVSVESGGKVCELKVRGDRRSRRGAAQSAKIQAKLELEQRSRNGTVTTKMKQGKCASGPIEITAGQAVVVKLNGAVVLSGTPALRATPSPTPTP
jgi:hypothetical protein